MKFANKILQGINRAIEKMIQEAKLKDEWIVYSENGNIIRIKARDLNKAGN